MTDLSELDAADATPLSVITLDGPAASGKSSVAKVLAQRLGIAYVSSGLLYRAAALLALEADIDPGDEDAVRDLLENTPVRLVPEAGANRVEVGGVDIAPRLHTHDVDGHVSAVARQPQVRAWVTERLRELTGPFVIDGRDMGSTVFPQARWKFYLDAPTEVRAKRRVGERAAELTVVLEALSRRDARDAKQSVPAVDAVHIDTGPMSLSEVVDAVHAVVATQWPKVAVSEP